MTQFDAPEEIVHAPARTSILAWTSLVLSLICCIPGLGALGALLGVGAVVGISKSDGRVKGMGLAIAGVVIGLIITLIWIFAAIGFDSAVKGLGRYADAITAVENDDQQAISSWVSATASPAEMAAFRDALNAEYGAFISPPNSVAGIFGDYLEHGERVQAVQNDARSLGYVNPVPIPMEFDMGVALIIIAMDDPNVGGTAPNNMPKAENIGFVAKDGSTVWLIDPSP